MSQFYASIQGNRGEATRMGSKASGITGHVRGWDVGARVDGYVKGESDVVAVRATGGSNDNIHHRKIAEISREGDTVFVELFDPHTGDAVGTWALD